MELFKTTGSQLAAIMKSANPAARIIALIGLLLAVGIGSYCYNLRGGGEKVCLFGGCDLSATELAAVETALGKAGESDYEVIDNRILVPQDRRAAALRAIDESGAMPKSITGYDSQKSTFAPFSTGQQQRNLDKAKKQEKICAMIREIQGIESVLVEYDETRSEGFPRTTQHTAAVTVRPVGGRHLEPYEIKAIRATVQSAVAGMQPDDIVVIDGNSGIAHDWQDQEDRASALKDYATVKQHHEEACKQKIQNVLKCYPGVRVDVQVEFEQDQRSHPVGSSYDTASNQPHLNVGRTVELAANVTSVTPGSNGHARIQPIMVSAHKPEITPVVLETRLPPSGQREFIPRHIGVSIAVPPQCVCRLAAIKLAKELRAADGTDTSDAGPLPAVSPAQIDECFQRIKSDIVHRVGPLLLGRNQVEDVEQLIAVSLDPDVEPSLESAPADGDKPVHLLEQINSKWYALLFPLVVVAGVILVRIGNRTHMLPSTNELISAAVQPKTSEAKEQLGDTNVFNEILHNDLEPTEKEIQLATDIDRAFESDYQKSLSGELVEMVEEDPRATISVFRSWLTDAA